ncbi:MAG: type I-B CRISPR-associated protein Cas7/Cst2/DevR [Clostridia bacterium]
MNKNSGLTITMIFKAQSLNYGEGIGNIAELKKINRGDGNTYSFASRQAIRYDIVRLGHKMFGWNLETIDKSKGTLQFMNKISIKESEEMDIFGYMKTKKAKSKKDSENEENEVGGSDTRSAVARLSNAISLEKYKSDMDFLTNKGFADRINEFPNLANIEQHLSFYTYTVTIDLERIGIDGETKIDAKQRAKRVKELLEIIKILNREIRGREENLSPLFVIGGIYQVNSPFFLGRIKLDTDKNGFALNLNILNDTLNLKLSEEKIEDNTSIGLVSDIFSNTEEIKNKFPNSTKTVQNFFEDIEEKVEQYYKN